MYVPRRLLLWTVPRRLLPCALDCAATAAALDCAATAAALDCTATAKLTYSGLFRDRLPWTTEAEQLYSSYTSQEPPSYWGMSHCVYACVRVYGVFRDS